MSIFTGQYIIFCLWDWRQKMVCKFFFPAVVFSFSSIDIANQSWLILIWFSSMADRPNIYLFACGLLVTSRYYIVLVQAGVWHMRGSHGCRSRRVGADLRLDILSVAKSKKMARSPPRTHQVQVARRSMILCWQEHGVMDVWLML